MEEKKQVSVRKGREYKFCTCGSTKILPFCDESHKELNEKTGSNFKSLRITPEEDITLEIFSKNWETAKNKINK